MPRSILLILFFIFTSVNLYSQDNLEITALNRITLYRHDTVFQFFVMKAPEKFKVQSSLKYYWFYPDTILITQGGFSGKLLDGSYKVFYPNKNIKIEGKFEHGTQTGVWKSWYPDGKLNTMTTWDKGKREGAFEEYDATGKLVISGIYKDDKVAENK